MSDYLSEEEQLERLRSWWQENGTMLLVGVVLVVGGFVGWRWYQSHTQAEIEAASDLYAAYESADGDARTAALAELAKRAPGSSYHALALFGEAGALVEDGDYEEASALYQQVLDDPADTLIADLARLRLAAVLQGLDRSDDALALLNAITSSGYRRAALELKGDIHQALGERQAANAAYTQALEAAEEGAQTQLLKLKAVNTEGGVPEAMPADEAEEVIEVGESVEDADETDEAQAVEAPEDPSEETASEDSP